MTTIGFLVRHACRDGRHFADGGGTHGARTRLRDPSAPHPSGEQRSDLASYGVAAPRPPPTAVRAWPWCRRSSRRDRRVPEAGRRPSENGVAGHFFTGLFAGGDSPDARRERPRDERRAGSDTRVETRPEKLPQHGYLVTEIPSRRNTGGGRYDGFAALLGELVEHLHGKEGVDGSSPSEGFRSMAGLCGREPSALFSSSTVRGATASTTSAFASCKLGPPSGSRATTALVGASVPDRGSNPGCCISHRSKAARKSRYTSVSETPSARGTVSSSPSSIARPCKARMKSARSETRRWSTRARTTKREARRTDALVPCADKPRHPARCPPPEPQAD